MLAEYRSLNSIAVRPTSGNLKRAPTPVALSAAPREGAAAFSNS
jgi:hypothetical protein